MTLMAQAIRCTMVLVLMSVFAFPLAGRAKAAQATATTPAQPQCLFSSPKKAVKALQEATAAHDKEAMRRIFGPALKDLVSPDKVQNANDFTVFAKRLAEMTQLVREGDSKVTLTLGGDNWPFPIPIVKKDGKWFFDTQAGKEEILNRRIGENELRTIQFCEAYVLAQREYFAQDWDNDDVLEHAQHFRSTPGKKDGLYWPTAETEAPSPLGPLVAQARAEGYGKKKGDTSEKRRPYHGYYFKILTKQGENAPGGKYDYLINGHMVAGFALVAWPAEYGSSGVMTFIVNQRGKVYQKDLGAKTTDLANAMAAYDPDDTWTVVKE